MIFKQITMTEPFALATIIIKKEQPTTACKQINKKQNHNPVQKKNCSIIFTANPPPTSPIYLLQQVSVPSAVMRKQRCEEVEAESYTKATGASQLLWQHFSIIESPLFTAVGSTKGRKQLHCWLFPAVSVHTCHLLYTVLLWPTFYRWGEPPKILTIPFQAYQS